MGILSDIFGKKPALPSYQPVDVGTQQTAAIQGNIAALPSAEELAAGVNTFSQDQLTRMWQSVLPQYKEMLGGVADTLMQEVKGQIPTDVAQRVEDVANARAVGGGFGGSGLGRNLTARDLGLTSLDISNRAIAGTMNFLATLRGTSIPAQMSPTSMMLSPMQRYQATAEQYAAQFQSQVQQAEVAAMPDPVVRGVWGIIHELGMKAAGMGMGMGMGGGGMGGAPGGGGGGGGGGGSDQFSSINEIDALPGQQEARLLGGRPSDYAPGYWNPPE